jgi:hypothetical protein
LARNGQEVIVVESEDASKPRAGIFPANPGA